MKYQTSVNCLELNSCKLEKHLETKCNIYELIALIVNYSSGKLKNNSLLLFSGQEFHVSVA